MTNYRPILFLTRFPKYSKSYAQHLHTDNIMITEHMVSGKGNQIKMPISD